MVLQRVLNGDDHTLPHSPLEGNPCPRGSWPVEFLQVPWPKHQLTTAGLPANIIHNKSFRIFLQLSAGVIFTVFCLNCSSGIYQPRQKTTSGIPPPWALFQKLLSPLLAHAGLLPADPHQSEACLASSPAVSPTLAVQGDCVAWRAQHPSQGPGGPSARQSHLNFGDRAWAPISPRASQVDYPTQT